MSPDLLVDPSRILVEAGSVPVKRLGRGALGPASAAIRKNDFDLAVAMQVTHGSCIGSSRRHRGRDEIRYILEQPTAQVQRDGDRATRPGRVVESGIADHEIEQ